MLDWFRPLHIGKNIAEKGSDLIDLRLMGRKSGHDLEYEWTNYIHKDPEALCIFKMSKNKKEIL